MITFSYQLSGHGFAEARVADEDNELIMWPSFLSDAFGDLVGELTALVKGATEAKLVWADEPGEFRWILRVRALDLQVSILGFHETFSRLPDEKGLLLFSAADTLQNFVRKVVGQGNMLIGNHGSEEYKRLWGHDFPQAKFHELERYLKVQ
jgi:hypothetical protein